MPQKRGSFFLLMSNIQRISDFQHQFSFSSRQEQMLSMLAMLIEDLSLKTTFGQTSKEREGLQKMKNRENNWPKPSQKKEPSEWREVLAMKNNIIT